MKDFFRGVQRHIGKLDAEQLRNAYGRVTDEMLFQDALIHAISEGIVVLDAAGEVIRENPAAKRILGDDVRTAITALKLPLGVNSKLETTISYPEERFVEIQTFPVIDSTLVLLRDTTAEKKRTEEELRTGATKAVCDLAAGVAHEIGNPLNAIAMNLQLLARDPTDSESLEICQSQVKRLDGILREFLSALRTRRPVLAPGSPADPLTNCLAALKRQFEERSIRVTVDIPATLPAVALDKDQIEQVFFNLLKNALEAIRDGDKIEIEISSDDSDVSVRIRDTGLGMSEEQLTHLFEPYRTTKEKGTGLGLMVSKRIVSDHGGTIVAESKEGEGTIFTVRLPRIERRIRVLN